MSDQPKNAVDDVVTIDLRLPGRGYLGTAVCLNQKVAEELVERLGQLEETMIKDLEGKLVQMVQELPGCSFGTLGRINVDGKGH